MCIRDSTYTVTHDPVGSSGTETQCFQLLRDSTVIMKDGSIVANNLQLQICLLYTSIYTNYETILAAPDEALTQTLKA